MKLPSNFISRWANFGYDRDSWQESLLDFLYFINDPADANTPLPPVGMAAIVGQSPVAALSGYSPGDILIHSADPDTLFVKKPQEVRVIMERDSGVIWAWDSSMSYWYVVGKLDNVEDISVSVDITASIWAAQQVNLARPVLSNPPWVYLVGSGYQQLDVNYWMPDASTITFAPSSGPASLGNFPISPGVDRLLIRYMSAALLTIGGV